MIKIVKVKGISMSPTYKDGDYLILISPKVSKIRPKDKVVFNHFIYGTMVKSIKNLNYRHKTFSAVGCNTASVGTEQMGEIPFHAISGKVLFSITK